MQKFLTLLLVLLAVTNAHGRFGFSVDKCIKIEGDMRYKITYDLKEKGKMNTTEWLALSGGNVDLERSNCSEGVAVATFGDHNEIEFKFGQKDGGFVLKRVTMDVGMDDKDYPGHKENETKVSIKSDKVLEAISAKKDKAYICDATKTFKGEKLEIELKNFKTQAFVNATDFLDGDHCPEDKKKPKPKPVVEDHWRVRAADNKTCIALDANVTVAVKYLMKDKKPSDWVQISIPKENVRKISGSCNTTDKAANLTGNVQKMVVEFLPSNKSDDNNPVGEWGLILWFTDDKSHTEGHGYALYKVELNAQYQSYEHLFPNASQGEELFVSHKGFGGDFGAALNRSVGCSDVQLVIGDRAKLGLKSFKGQAYMTQETFGEVSTCRKDMRTSDVVPIIVGALLAVLVIVVLVGYLIGRARAKRQGYSSV